GKDKNRHWDKRDHNVGRSESKTTVVGAVKRKGNVIARVIENVRTETLEAFVRETVSNRVSLLCTDDFSGYRRLGRKYPHGVINHSEGKHVQHGVIGAIHTNTIDFGPLSNAESLEASIRSAESICRCTSRNFSSTIEKMQTSSERRSADAKARFASIGADACCSLFNRSCIIADCAV